MGRGWCGWCCCGARSGNSKIPNRTLKEEVDEEDDENFYKVRYDHTTDKLLGPNALTEQDALQLNVANLPTQDDKEAQTDRKALKK